MRCSARKLRSKVVRCVHLLRRIESLHFELLVTSVILIGTALALSILKDKRDDGANSAHDPKEEKSGNAAPVRNGSCVEIQQ